MEALRELMKKMDDINYGYIYNGVNIYPDSEFAENDEDFPKKYHLLSPTDLIKNKYGVCWDQVELERYYLEQENIKCHSYFIVTYDNKEFPTHTFLAIENKDKYYWFEHSWKPYKGIYEYNSLNDLLADVKSKFCKNRSLDDTVIYEYIKPEYNISSYEFFKHCESGKKIEI